MCGKSVIKLLEKKLGVTFNNGAGASVNEQQVYVQALNYLSRYPGMGEILHSLATMSVTINFNNSNDDRYDPNTNTIFWDPTSAMTVIQANGQLGAQSPALGLFHEICHWLYAHTGEPKYFEYAATNFETQAAISLGEPVRPTYNTTSSINPWVVVTNPTAHSGGGYWQAVDFNGNPIKGPAYDPNHTFVPITAAPTEGTGSTPGGSGGGEHGGIGGIGGSGGIGSGISNPAGGGGHSGGGHWRPVPQNLDTPEPYDAEIVSHEQSITIVGMTELPYSYL